ncbi:hypothetical protein ACFPVX_01665 [Cohnella faecalis]|uniref:Uncharacterized protein n=1 Tax=Cohnella faecalis TaxID=2315694 RepID=A0A398CQB7_9BACL|nr:hypothetical protein [Cohnella faecalis]RIE04725.1 hypothetical protein D3H35_04370 [Cohnella faecalis]
MNIRILAATMKHDESNGYLGHVRFEAEGHKQPYELTLQSDKRIDDWNYALNFLDESGSEQQIEAVEKALEEDDDIFDSLVDAALASLDDAK